MPDRRRHQRHLELLGNDGSQRDRRVDLRRGPRLRSVQDRALKRTSEAGSFSRQDSPFPLRRFEGSLSICCRSRSCSTPTTFQRVGTADAGRICTVTFTSSLTSRSSARTPRSRSRSSTWCGSAGRTYRFPPVFWLFACFIFACGAGHLVEATIFWKPWYRFSGLLKMVTAVASWATVIALARALPSALHLPGLALINAQLRREIEERREVEAALRLSEQRYALAANGTNDGIWDWNMVTGEFLGSDRYWELMGSGLRALRSASNRSFWTFTGVFTRTTSTAWTTRSRRMSRPSRTTRSSFGCAGKTAATAGSTSAGSRCETNTTPRCAWRGGSSTSPPEKTAELERESLLEQLRLLNAELEARVADRTLQLSSSLKERELLAPGDAPPGQEQPAGDFEPDPDASTQARARPESLRARGVPGSGRGDRADPRATLPREQFLQRSLLGVREQPRARRVRATDTSPSSIQLDFAANEVSLPIDKAIPCGLILNELMTNAVKHAFPTSERGR